MQLSQLIDDARTILDGEGVEVDTATLRAYCRLNGVSADGYSAWDLATAYLDATDYGTAA